MPEPQSEYREQPVYWFTVLDIARERDDDETAAEAQRELRRLGVEVKFHPAVMQEAPG
jgi:hypothetical protein